MSRNCPANNATAKRDSRPTRHKAPIAPNTALYEILELDKDGVDESFLVESELPTPVSMVQFVGMTVMADHDFENKRRQDIQKLATIFAGLSVGLGRALTDTAAQAPTIGAKAERVWR